jgi:hypothetical protein
MVAVVMGAITLEQVAFRIIHGCLEQTVHLIPVAEVVAVDGVAVRLALVDLVLLSQVLALLQI